MGGGEGQELGRQAKRGPGAPSSAARKHPRQVPSSSPARGSGGRARERGLGLRGAGSLADA